MSVPADSPHGWTCAWCGRYWNAHDGVICESCSKYGQPPADSPRTPAEHAEALNESVARIRDHWAFPEDDFDAALAALVALADDQQSEEL